MSRQARWFAAALVLIGLLTLVVTTIIGNSHLHSRVYEQDNQIAQLKDAAKAKERELAQMEALMKAQESRGKP